jgi:LPS sulfotransferase NodH
MVRYVVIAFGRSGSTMLVNYLCSHPEAICYHEPFNRDRPYRQTDNRAEVEAVIDEVWDPGLDYTEKPGWLKQILALVGGRKNQEVRHPKQGLHYGRLRAVGFKATIGQVLVLKPQIMEVLRDEPEVRVILLRRRNTLRRFLSYEQARASKRWHASHPGNTAPRALTIAFGAFCEFVDQQAVDNYRITDMLDRDDRPWIDIAYEDLLADRDGVMTRVLGLLDLEPIADYQTKTVQLIHGSLPELIVNYDELLKAARGTKYEAHLVDLT